jgi:hypothetical protein
MTTALILNIVLSTVAFFAIVGGLAWTFLSQDRAALNIRRPHPRAVVREALPAPARAHQ